MINTIFYYVDSLSFEDYLSKLNSGELLERTIVFAATQKAIYKGRVKYTFNSLNDFSDQEWEQKLDNIFSNSPYTLPIATKANIAN